MKLCNFAPVIRSHIRHEQIKGSIERKGNDSNGAFNSLGQELYMVNLYVANKHQPSIPILFQIADILDMDVRELLVSNKQNNNKTDRYNK